jgi:hypothetical protein
MPTQEQYYFKGLSLFIKELIDEFALDDFSPSTDNTNLKAKFKQIFIKETSFWKTVQIPQNWEEYWSFIEIKTFNHKRAVLIGFSFNSEDINIVACESLRHDFINKYWEKNVNLHEIWQNHKIIHDNLLEVIERSLRFAHRENRDDPF